MATESEQYSFETAGNRLKITIPVKLNWPLLALFSAALVVWAGMILTVTIYLLTGRSSSFVLTAILLIWILIWLWFGRFLWNRWQYHAATREILFIDDEQIIHRRPVSIFGNTTSYDRQHISSFYYSGRHRCPAFDYAYLHVYFGRSMKEDAADILIAQLNELLFPEETAITDDEL
jgi:hypothetical protein